MKAGRSAVAGAALTIAAAIAAPARATTPLPTRSAAPAAELAPAAAPPRRLAQSKPAPAPPPRAPVAPPPAVDDAAVDAELLEFLGSVGDDTDDGGDWLDFLASTDVEKVAKGRAKTPARGK